MVTYEGGPAEAAAFFARWPATAQPATLWQRVKRLHAIMAAAGLAYALTTLGDPVSPQWVVDVAKWPQFAGSLTQSLRMLSTCNHGHPERANILSTVASSPGDVADVALVATLRKLTTQVWGLTLRNRSPALSCEPSKDAQTTRMDKAEDLTKAANTTAANPSAMSAKVPPKAMPHGTAKRTVPRGTRGRKHRPSMIAQPERFANYRALWPPLGPMICCEEFRRAK